MILKPSPRLPILITLLGIGLLPLPFNPWPSIVIIIFGLFLLIQSLILRLEFSDKAMIVWQLGRELRNFPFENWLAWRIFLPWLPRILYFREKACPHLLPILFDPINLEKQLQLRVGQLKKPKEQASSSY